MIAKPAYDHRAFKIAGWLALAAMAIAIVYCCAALDWEGALVISGFFAFSTYFVLRRRDLPSLLSFLFAIGGIVGAIGYIFNLYKTGCYDELAHLYCSFSTTALFGYLVYKSLYAKVPDLSRLLLILTIANLGVGISVSWEFFEYIVGIIGNIEDTLSDLALDVAGSVLGALLAASCIRQQLN